MKHLQKLKFYQNSSQASTFPVICHGTKLQ